MKREVAVFQFNSLVRNHTSSARAQAGLWLFRNKQLLDVVHSCEPNIRRLGESPVGPRQEHLMCKADHSNLVRPLSLDGETDMNQKPL